MYALILRGLWCRNVPVEWMGLVMLLLLLDFGGGEGTEYVECTVCLPMWVALR